MNKYSFDFQKIEDVLYEAFGIVNPTNIMSLKMQVRKNLTSLIDSYDKKIQNVTDKNALHHIETDKEWGKNEIDKIAKENDINLVLKELITIREYSIRKLDAKVRPTDTYDVAESKRQKISLLNGARDLLNVPSIIDLINRRNFELNNIDCENRIVNFSKVPTKIDESALKSPDFYPHNKLSIAFNKTPASLPDDYKRVLEDAGTYVYDFGTVTHSAFPDKSGKYTQSVAKENMYGIIKKDEFGATKKYFVLTSITKDWGKVPPEFYRDVMFSDMLLRNSKNNMGYLGVPEKDYNSKYGYRAGFKEIGINDLLRAIYLENDKSQVTVESNAANIKSLNSAENIILEKLELALRKLFDNRNQLESKEDQRGA